MALVFKVSDGEEWRKRFHLEIGFHSELKRKSENGDLSSFFGLNSLTGVGFGKSLREVLLLNGTQPI